MSGMNKAGKRAYWAKHVSACEARGTLLAEYAREQGLNVKAFYRWKVRLAGGVGPSGMKPATAFVPVRVAASMAACRVIFPNGVVVECGSVDAGVLSSLAMLRIAP